MNETNHQVGNKPPWLGMVTRMVTIYNVYILYGNFGDGLLP